MTEIKGIVAGVGNKETNENVITPQFDANVVDFMVGGSAIVEGLNYLGEGWNHRRVNAFSGTTPVELSNASTIMYYATIKEYIGKGAKNISVTKGISNVPPVVIYDEETGYVTCTLYIQYPNYPIVAAISWQIEATLMTRGIVVHKGYRGEVTNDIDGFAGDKVYARFVLHNNPQVVDEFYIITGDEEYEAETIENGVVTYNLLLYNNGVKNPDLYDIPAIAEHSLTCDTVLEGGVIDKKVEGYTQPVSDNSLRIATTKYVENQIAHDIAYDTTTIDLTITYEGETYKPARITLQKKAKQVLCSVNTDISEYDYPPIADLHICNEKLPNNFLPKKDEKIFTTHTFAGTPQDRRILFVLLIEKDGTITILRWTDLVGSFNDVYEFFPTATTSGWETL